MVLYGLALASIYFIFLIGVDAEPTTSGGQAGGSQRNDTILLAGDLTGQRPLRVALMLLGEERGFIDTQWSRSNRIRNDEPVVSTWKSIRDHLVQPIVEDNGRSNLEILCCFD